MISGRWFVTPHAVHRYQERVRRGLTYEQALAELINAAESARFVRDTRDGLQLWRAGKPTRARLIVGPGEGGRMALVTVLPAFDGMAPCEEVWRWSR